MSVLGIDVGGSGIKGAPVDLAQGGCWWSGTSC
jgi:hypothetical protein